MTSIGVFASIFDDQNRILCVKRNYDPWNWTTPGGALDPGETPIEALKREVLEESGYRIEPLYLIGIYSAPGKDDLVLNIAAEIVGEEDWEPNGEISERGFFDRNALPSPMKQATLNRILDAFDRKTGVMRIHTPEDAQLNP